MRHATEQDLKSVSALLDEIRRFPDLKEKKTGVFYRKSKAFLHFHEDSGDMYADVRLGGADFDRFRVATKTERNALLRAVATFVKS